MKLALAALALLTATGALGQAQANPCTPLNTTGCTAGGLQPKSLPDTPISKWSSSETLAIWNGMNAEPTTHYEIVNDSATVTVPGKEGRIERLYLDEYAHLEKLRQAVKDAETEIAKAHGVDVEGCHSHGDFFCASIDGHSPFEGGTFVNYNRDADRYEFRGHFLLVNVPGPIHE